MPKMCQLLVQNCRNGTDGDRPEDILTAEAIGFHIRSNCRKQNRPDAGQQKTINQRHPYGGPDAEGGRLLCLLMVPRSQAAGHQAGTADAKQIGQPGKKHEHGHTQGNRSHLVRIPDLSDEKGVRHVVNHRNQLADHRRNDQRDHRTADRRIFK